MPRLAIDLTYQPVGGALAQIKEIIKSINVYGFDEILFFVTEENLDLFDYVKNKKILFSKVKFSNTSIIRRTIWAQIFLPLLLIVNKVDILFCPGNISPILNTKKKAQWIGTVGPFEPNFISSFGWRQRVILFISKYLMIFSSLTSDMVIFESNYTRDLFVKKFRQKKEKSTVLYIGNNDFFKPVKEENATISEFRNYEEFILCVSHLYPYKNVEVLIKSYIKLRLHQRNLHILIAGSISDKNYHNKLNKLLKEHNITQFVIFLGRVDMYELRELYSLCKFMVFTSPFENFAYTLVEAMNCGAAIIATNTTAMPETCGKAALYFSPHSTNELSDHILTYLDDKQKLIKFKKLALKKSNEYDEYDVVNEKTNLLLERLL